MSSLSLNWIYHLKASLLLLETVISMALQQGNFQIRQVLASGKTSCFLCCQGNHFKMGKTLNPSPQQSPKQYTFFKIKNPNNETIGNTKPNTLLYIRKVFFPAERMKGHHNFVFKCA